MKSEHLKFANPKLQEINFEIRPAGTKSILMGVFYTVLLILFLPIIFFLLILFLGGGSFVIIILALFMPILIKVYRLTRRHLINPLSLAADPRAPILYLRSFADDFEENNNRSDKRTSEELMFKALKDVGPVIAVGNPSDSDNSIPLLGATRIYINENWQAEVMKLMAISQLVIFEANNSQNLIWEMITAKNIVPPNRLLISFLSRYDYHLSKYEFGGTAFGFVEFKRFRDFEKIFREIFSPSFHIHEPHICFIYFDGEWHPFSASLDPSRDWNIFKLKYAWNLLRLFYMPDYQLSFWKVKRAILMILHYNKIIFHELSAFEIAAAEKKSEEEKLNLKTEVNSVIKVEKTINPNHTDSLIFEGVINNPRNRVFRIGLGVITVLVTIVGGAALYNNSDSVLTQEYFRTASQCQIRGDNTCALENCNKIVEIDPSNANAFRCIGEAYAGKGNYEQAIQRYDKAIELDSTNADTYYNRAASYFNLQKDFDQIIKDTTKAIELDKNKAIYFGVRSAAYFSKKNYEAAFSDANKATELDSAYSMAYGIRGAIHLNNKNYQESLADLNKAIKLDSGDWIFYKNRGTTYLMLQDYDRVAQDFYFAAKLNPDDAESYFYRGIALYERRNSLSKNDDYEQAIESFSKAIELNPKYADAYYNRALVYEKIREKSKASADRRMFNNLKEQQK